MNEAIYAQCVLRNGNRELVTWIPAKDAKVSKMISIDGEYGWMIVSVHQTRQEREIARMRKL